MYSSMSSAEINDENGKNCGQWAACQLPTTPGLAQGRANQDGLNAEDKSHIVLCICDKTKAGVRLSVY